jgi:hydroxyacylglutathione hydrolase
MVKVCKDVYFYPWMSYQENNSNTVFIGGSVPAIIDPGHSHLFAVTAENMARDGQNITKSNLVLFTHSHPDHIEAADRFDDNVLKGIGEVEYSFLQQAGKELFLAAGGQPPQKPFKLLLNEGELKLGHVTLQVILTPGHSPGSLCFYYGKEKVLISGDTLFQLGVGRTDLPGGSMEDLARSIERLSKLDIECLLPGHGNMIKGRKAIEKNFDVIMNELFR